MREFTNEEFDLIIDKACLDSIVVITRASYIYCSEDSLKNVEEMLSEVSRILK
ncbi:hypothetical protein C923_05673 [Plasmodium falciparum UGT5.1]|uniref:Uncharacterized protein n=1 Tax=Plasmodium falciparum UGT5.1 TaxID=1237627 RepID=W7J571_PLAFA|nr:hypothetical protein C923_05673 [Plasmodium falciparum UGT5.1]